MTAHFGIKYSAKPNFLCVVKRTGFEKHVMHISIQHLIFCSLGFFLDQNIPEQLGLGDNVLDKEH